MTISLIKNKEVYQGDGVNTKWPIKFSFTNPSQIQVHLTDTYGVTTLLSSAYVVDTKNEEVFYPGYIGVPPANKPPTLPKGWKITISRKLPLTQEVALENQGAWNPNVIENQLDRITMIQQQQQEELNRCPKLDISDTTNDPTSYMRAINSSMANADIAAISATNSADIATVQATNAANSAAFAEVQAKSAEHSASEAAIVYGTMLENINNVINLPSADLGGNIWISNATTGSDGLDNPIWFATSALPANPQVNELWFDAETRLLKIYDGNQWQLFNFDTLLTAMTVPSNPVINQLWFDAINRIVKIWDGTQWQLFNTGIYSGFAGAPSNPVLNQVWFDSVNCKTWIWNGTKWKPFIQNMYYSATSITSQTIAAPSVPVLINGLSITITPLRAESRFLIMAVVNGAMTYVASSLVYRNNAALSTASNHAYSGLEKPFAQATTYLGWAQNNSSYIMQHHILYVDSPNTTNPITYDIRHISPASTTVVNDRGSKDMATPSSLVIIEF